jgi:hypothetical protein
MNNNNVLSITPQQKAQAPVAEDQFGVTRLPKFWFRQFAELWPLNYWLPNNWHVTCKRDIWHYCT